MGCRHQALTELVIKHQLSSACMTGLWIAEQMKPVGSELPGAIFAGHLLSL